ncbi:MAG: Pectic acid lyase [Planctomycetes bacterium ADurb.Bin401]|nr:MAG: Pectic acid lyase [Planctomycetes bacterium ADurb.Bin401]
MCCKTLFCTVVMLCSALYSYSPQQKIDLSGFINSAHHWYDVSEKANIINPRPNQPQYQKNQVKEIADNILLYQRDNGGWPKNYDMRAVLTELQKQEILKAKSLKHTTFDNSTTFSQIRYLAKAYQTVKDERYKQSALAGIDFTLSAQYDNGGWPQFYPLLDNYTTHITFNDGAMIGIMNLFKDILDNEPFFSFVDDARRKKIKKAFDKGLDCILRCQIQEDGNLIGWCQQHDERDFTPAKARAYELPAICNAEGAQITIFLMGLDNPTQQVINAVDGAVKWFEQSKILGIRVEEIESTEIKFASRVNTTKRDRIVVNDPNAPPIWARFYKLKTHEPFFSNRKSEILKTMAEVDRERRVGYSWYTYKPQEVLDKYPAWKNK